MKRIQYILSIMGIMLAASSCYKDDSQTGATDKEVITITGINPSYDKVSLVDKIELSPTVVSSKDGAEFDYFWGIYETNVQGSAPKLDTIARTKDLNYLVTQAAKGWVLVFGAKNKKTGYTGFVTSSINVITQFTRGWYVAKDNGTETDVDLFLTPTSIVPTSKKENVFSEINSKKLAGKAQLFGFYSDYKSTANGTLGNTRALFVVTDKDASVVNINTFKEIRNYAQLFYEAPEIKAPYAVLNGSAANYFINNGQVHSIYAMSANTGQFGGKQLKDNLNTPYHVSKYFLTSWITDPFFFDETSSSFVSAGGAGTVLNKVSDATITAMPANGNNKKLLYMGLKNYYPLTGYAVFQDKTDPSLKILSNLTTSVSAFKMENDTLLNTDKLYSASRYALLDGDESMMYFAVGNEIWSRNLANKFETLQFTVPAGEELTFIRHRKYAGSATLELPYYFNYVMIGTKSGGNYKVRMFTKTSGNLAASPAVTLEGSGSVGDVIYIAPNISGTTFNNTY